MLIIGIICVVLVGLMLIGLFAGESGEEYFRRKKIEHKPKHPKSEDFFIKGSHSNAEGTR